MRVCEMAARAEFGGHGYAFSLRLAAAMRGGFLLRHLPEHAQILNGFEERVEVHRLDDERIHAQLVAADQVAFLARGGEHHDRHRAGQCRRT